MSTIRDLFSGHRPIDRPIEKVIDYAAADDDRLAAEISEYEATANVEEAFQKFLDLYGDALTRGQVTEIGVWVSGFYGSGKSSFTKYLGLALDHDRRVNGTLFRDLLGDRFTSTRLQAELKAVAAKHRTAVIMLDLGTEQLAETTAASVTTVLYRKVLEWAGYSLVTKLADLELTLEGAGKLDEFRDAYRERYQGEWSAMHNQPGIGVRRAATLVPDFLPTDYPDATSFSELRFEEALDVREVARRIIDLVKRRSNAEAVLILIDEAGQYVAPRGELILNLDGLARALKEEGGGKVWLMATGQQTLAEVVSRAALNSEELTKLRDRFPISIQLTASDIREITYKRLLTKSPEGTTQLRELLGPSIGSLITHTRLTQTALYTKDPDIEAVVRYYPFLPQHFELLLELVRNLARSTGGIGLRSAIRVIQDLLVDASKSLPPGVIPIAKRPIGDLASADDFYDTLRNDIEKVLPHAIGGVEKIQAALLTDPLAVRVAKSIAVLQVVEGFPRTRANIAALIYSRVGDASLAELVNDAVARLISTPEFGVIDDPQTGGIGFVSDSIARIRGQRDRHIPTGAEIGQQRARLLSEIFAASISANLLGAKTVTAGVRVGRQATIVDGGDLLFRLEHAATSLIQGRRDELLAESNGPDWKTAIGWLYSLPEEVDDLLAEVVRSELIVRTLGVGDVDRDIAQFLRSERRRAEEDQVRAARLTEAALVAGTFIHHGITAPVGQLGTTVEGAARAIVADVAGRVFSKFHLAPVRASTELAVKFLQVDDLRKMPADRDPLKLVKMAGGQSRIDVDSPVLSEALRTFSERARDAGAGRLQGSAVLDVFASSPYGWTKDATRYLFAALFRTGVIELHAPSGLIKTAGPHAYEALSSNASFGRVGVALRDTRPPMEVVERAAGVLQRILGEDVLPLEDRIADAVRSKMPGVLERISSLPARLRLLRLAGVDRAVAVHETCTDLLAGDAGDAAVRLGEVGSTIETDIRWAEATVRALDDGGEEIAQQAQAVMVSLEELRAMDEAAAQSLGLDDIVGQIHDSLASEGISDQLVTIRGAMRKVDAAVATALEASLQTLSAEVANLTSRLESMPTWVRLTDDDRTELASRAQASLRAAAELAGSPTSKYKVVLAHRAGLRTLGDVLADEVRKRAAPLDETVRIARVRPGELVTAAVVTQATLEPWLGGLRNRVGDFLLDADEVHIEDDLG